eukprot:4927557-Amphidinium_carterae.1
MKRRIGIFCHESNVRTRHHQHYQRRQKTGWGRAVIVGGVSAQYWPFEQRVSGKNFGTMLGRVSFRRR